MDTDRLSIEVLMVCDHCESQHRAMMPLQPPTGDGILKLDYKRMNSLFYCEKCNKEFRFGDNDTNDIWEYFNELKRDILQLEVAVRETRIGIQNADGKSDRVMTSIQSIESRLSDLSSDVSALELQLESY